MKKRLNLFSVALLAMVAGLAGFSAYEAHVINVTATIENALNVPIKEIDFGTVFPQEALESAFQVSLSNSFVEASEVEGYQWASSVVTYDQGPRKNGTPVLPERSDPNSALGEAENNDTFNFFSLGFGGSIVLGFDHYIVNAPGNDVEVMVTETSFGSPGCEAYPERVRVSASKYPGGPWTLLGEGCLDSEFDLNTLDWAKYLLLEDISNTGDFNDTADGFDIDGVKTTARERLGTVSYILRQKPKCVADDPEADPQHPQVRHDEEGNFECPEGSTMMPLLCPYLSKHEQTEDGTVTENDSEGIAAFHGLPGEWTMSTVLDTQVDGRLSVPSQDLNDEWLIDLKVPCFEGSCAQDWADFVFEYNEEANPDDYIASTELESEIWGCDLWLEITGIDTEEDLID